jgi:hypothetical protein
MGFPWQPPHPAPPVHPAPQPDSSPRALSAGRPMSGVRKAGLATAVIACVFGAGLAGVIVGTQIGAMPTTPAAAPSTTPTSVKPSADEIRVETVDLCTRFATGIRAMPSPQKSALDVIPTIDYVGAALSDNPNADGDIRAAVLEDLRLARAQAAALSGEPPAGAIQPSGGWTAAAGNDADEHVFKLCRAWRG